MCELHISLSKSSYSKVLMYKFDRCIHVSQTISPIDLDLWSVASALLSASIDITTEREK